MTDKKVFYEIAELKNTWSSDPSGKEAVISQEIVLRCDRAATMFIAQYIDDIEIFEAMRYPAEKGDNRIRLRPMRIIRPRQTGQDGAPFTYTAGVHVFAGGYDEIVKSEPVKR